MHFIRFVMSNMRYQMRSACTRAYTHTRFMCVNRPTTPAQNMFAMFRSPQLIKSYNKLPLPHGQVYLFGGGGTGELIDDIYFTNITQPVSPFFRLLITDRPTTIRRPASASCPKWIELRWPVPVRSKWPMVSGSLAVSRVTPVTHRREALSSQLQQLRLNWVALECAYCVQSSIQNKSSGVAWETSQVVLIF